MTVSSVTAKWRSQASTTFLCDWGLCQLIPSICLLICHRCCIFQQCCLKKERKKEIQWCALWLSDRRPSKQTAARICGWTTKAFPPCQYLSKNVARYRLTLIWINGTEKSHAGTVTLPSEKLLEGIWFPDKTLTLIPKYSTDWCAVIISMVSLFVAALLAPGCSAGSLKQNKKNKKNNNLSWWAALSAI